MGPFDAKAMQLAYDTVAVDYLAAFGDDLDRLQLDRSVLDSAIDLADGSGPILDLGCGPGQVAGYLGVRGASVVGLDLAVNMLRLAAEQTATTRFACGDMRALPFRTGSASAVIGFYSIQHLTRSQLAPALAEMHRVLGPTGILVIATHLGDGEITIDEFLGHRVDPVGGAFYDEAKLRAELASQSFTVEQCRVRDPLPHEYPSQRIYLIARRGEPS